MKLELWKLFRVLAQPEDWMGVIFCQIECVPDANALKMTVVPTHLCSSSRKKIICNYNSFFLYTFQPICGQRQQTLILQLLRQESIILDCQCKTGLMHSWTQQVEQQQLSFDSLQFTPNSLSNPKLWIVFFSISHQHHLFYETKPSRFPVGLLTRRRCSRLIWTDHFQHATQRDVGKSNDVFSRMEICGLFLCSEEEKGKVLEEHGKSWDSPTCSH